MTSTGEELDQRILDAARDLESEHGRDAVTISAVATRSGVSRPTVYRRWPNRAALLFDVDLRDGVPGELPDLGSFRNELTAALTFLHHHMNSLDRDSHGQHVALMVADAGFATQVHRHRWIPDRHAVMPLWERGVQRGELDPDVDGEAFLDDVVSATMFRVLFWHLADDAWIAPYVDRVCRGVLTRP